ncbi:MAG TPA: formate dehydrogenase accessory sulfurtransferase FdhD [Actinomycetota bacterium]|nr:formate dehydrogenase accessory sulfurtransferase FdhD [Actinomycetota bacterium]
MTVRAGGETKARIVAIEDGVARERTDHLASEEPMEIRISWRGQVRTIAVTMRTPGHDFELACGFLASEGVIRGRDDLMKIAYCVDPEVDATQRFNIVTVELRDDALPDLRGLERHFFTNSSCGVCGKESLDQLELRGYATTTSGPRVTADVLQALPDRLREAQDVFESTGGLHAAGLFASSGETVAVREDVGRHNAVDKLAGWALLERADLSERILLVSGRTSYEIMQKALAAGIPIVCAVSAPSSLAVDVAQRFGMTLVGFLRGDRFNIYAGPDRITPRSF